MSKGFVIVLLSLFAVIAGNEPALQQFVKANNAFATSLYKKFLEENEGNFLSSPYSAATVLAFAQSGGKGATAQEIRHTLSLPDDNDRVELGIKESIAALKGNDLYTLRTANKMYVKNEFSINEGFRRAATETFNAELENIDFVPEETAAKAINEWVENQTNNKIKNLISPDVLNKYIRTVLINTIYFKGNWTNRFSNYSTKVKDFHKISNDVVKVVTMHAYREWFNYYENSELNAKMLELPFEGGDVSMVVVLPNEKTGLSALENQIDQVLSPQNFQREFLNVALPKFKIETTTELTETLKKLGIRKAFDENEADFSGIAGEKGDLVITKALQKTYIDVQEDGVEAAAATYLVVPVPISAFIGPPEPEPKEFIADHPFIFYIKAKDIIIFAGRVSDPGL